MATKRLSAAERRIQLLQVGRAVFASRGYEATSLDEVAHKAGVSKPIIYEHFGAKEGLYAAIVDREMETLVQSVSDVVGRGSPRERFEAAVVAFLTYAKEQPEGFAVLTRDSPTAQRTGLTRVIDDLAHRVGDIFQSEFQRAGYNAKVAPIYAHALTGMVTQVCQWWASEKKPFSVDHVARHVVALGWMGLRHLPKDTASPVTRGKRR